ncbi:hypothetical protein GCM10027174_12980 [Salinifilum aidingensis]
MTATEGKRKVPESKPGLVAGVTSLVFSVVGVVLVLAGLLVISPRFGTDVAGSGVINSGVAEAQRCRYSAVLSASGEDPGRNVGNGWVCWAKVTWDDGQVGVHEVERSQLRPKDVGQSVQVVAREVKTSSVGGRRAEVFRADYEPSPVLGGVLMVACILAGTPLVLAFPSYLWMLYKHRRRERAQ